MLTFEVIPTNRNRYTFIICKGDEVIYRPKASWGSLFDAYMRGWIIRDKMQEGKK